MLPLPTTQKSSVSTKTRSVISLAGESKSIWMSAWLAELGRRLPNRPISFLPHLEYLVMRGTPGEQREAMKTEARAWNGIYQMDMEPINCAMGSIKKPTSKPLETSNLQIPPVGHRHPVLCMPHPHTNPQYPHTPSACGWLPVCIPDGSENEL